MTTKKKQIFNTEGAIFMGSQRSSSNCKVGIYGVPYDGTTSYKPGTRFGPSAIRAVSNSIECFCPQLNLDLEELFYVDFGNLEIPFGAPEPVLELIKETTKEFLKKGIKPLLLGGEHSITSGAIQALTNHYPDLIIIQLDAHADLRNEWLGSRHSHACSMRRCLDILPSKQIFQIGIRSGSRSEFIEMVKEKRLIPQRSGQPATELFEALQHFQNKPIYLTVDLDWFDPSVMPGTGTPEPGGFFWQDFAAIIDVLKGHQMIGADIVELAPKLDSSEISSILAAKVTRSLIMLLSLSD